VLIAVVIFTVIEVEFMKVKTTDEAAASLRYKTC